MKNVLFDYMIAIIKKNDRKPVVEMMMVIDNDRVDTEWRNEPCFQKQSTNFFHIYMY